MNLAFAFGTHTRLPNLPVLSSSTLAKSGFKTVMGGIEI